MGEIFDIIRQIKHFKNSQRKVYEPIGKAYGLSAGAVVFYSQLIDLIDENGVTSNTEGEIVKILHTSVSSFNSCINELLLKGYVKLIRGKDRRKSYIKVILNTSLMHKVKLETEKFNKRMFQGINENDLDIFRRLLRSL